MLLTARGLGTFLERWGTWLRNSVLNWESEAEFVISPRDRSRAPLQGRFAKSVPLADEGYASLVAAEKALLTEFAGTIGSAVDALVQARETSTGG